MCLVDVGVVYWYLFVGVVFGVYMVQVWEGDVCSVYQVILFCCFGEFGFVFGFGFGWIVVEVDGD